MIIYCNLKTNLIEKYQISFILEGEDSTYDIGFQFLKAALIRTSSFVEMDEYLQEK